MYKIINALTQDVLKFAFNGVSPGVGLLYKDTDRLEQNVNC